MNLTQIQPKAKIIFVIIVVLLIVVIITMLISSSKKEKTQPQAQPTPSIAPNIIAPPTKKTEELQENIQRIKKRIIESKIKEVDGDLILVEDTNYRISYISLANVFFVDILKDPAEIHRKAAQDWFLQFGLKQEDLCDLPVRFVLSTLEIRKTNPNFNNQPDNCQATPIKSLE